MLNQEIKEHKILIVEDDFDTLWMTNKMLEMHGYHVLTAVTAKQGIEIFSQNTNELKAVIIDLTLPDADGELVVSEIIKEFPKMPIIITTGLEDREQKKRLMNRGIKDYLVKPFDLHFLIDVLAKIE